MKALSDKNDQVQAILHHPQFQLLVHKKRRLSGLLSVLLIVLYFGFITLVAVAPQFMHQSLAGGTTTIAIPMGVSVIVIAFILCGIYVGRANGEFDRLTQALVDETTSTGETP